MSPPPTTGGLPGQCRLSRVRYPRRSSAAEVSRDSGGRGSAAPGQRAPLLRAWVTASPESPREDAAVSAVGTPRALGRSVGLSAARRRRSGLLGTVGGLRAPGLHGVHPEEAARAAAAALLQGEVRGAGGREGGQRPGALPQAAGASRLREPRVGPAAGGLGLRRPGQPRARMGASSRRPPATGLRGRLLEKRVRRLHGRGHPRPRKDLGKATASRRSRPLVAKRTSAPRVLPRAVLWPTRLRKIQLRFQQECGLNRFCKHGLGLWELRSGWHVVARGASQAGYT